MKRNKKYLLMGAVCILALAVSPFAAYSADSASIIVTNMPTCMTPGEVKMVTATVTNTGTETWHIGSPADPATCPPGVTPTPGSEPGSYPDCRHALGYRMDGAAIKGDRSDLPMTVGPGGSVSMMAKVCASDTSATRNCDAAGNPPLAVGSTHTVNWQMLHEWVAWLPVAKSYSIQVKSSCSIVGELNLCKIKPWICKGYMVKPRIPKKMPEPDPRWREYLEEIQMLKNKYPSASTAERMKMDQRANELDNMLRQKGFNQKYLQ